MTETKHGAGDTAAHSDTDVLIVGAGPVGLSLALMLASRGIDVAVYERWPAPYLLPRAVAMAHDCVRSFQAAGLIEQLKPLLDLNFGEFTGNYYTPDGEVVMSQFYPGMSESGWPMMTPFNQPDLEEMLNEQCATHPLVTIHRGWSAVGVTQTDQFAQVLFDPVDGAKPRAGNPVTGQARFVIGCDGANSSVLEMMDTTITDTGFASTWLVLDVLPTTDAHKQLGYAQILNPARPATVVPSGRGRQRFEFMALEGETAEDLTPPAKAWALMAPWGINPGNSELVRSAIYTFRGRWADAWRDGRLLLAGDAAHLMPPFMGQGFGSGIRDCAALVWRIELILAGKAPLDLLDSYTSERLPHVTEIVQQSTMLAQMCCILDPVAAEHRDAALRAAMADPALAPPPPAPWRLGPGLGVAGDPNAGFLSWQGNVEIDGKVGLFDDVGPSGVFVMMGAGVDPLGSLSAETRALWTRLGGHAVTIGDEVRDLDGGYAVWFEKLGAQVVLVRPDYYVFGTAETVAGAEHLVRQLVSQIGLIEQAQAVAA